VALRLLTDPPHNDDAEHSVIGAVLLRPEAISSIPELEPDHFYQPRCRVVFAAMRALHRKGVAIDPVTLEVEIERDEKLAAVGGIVGISEFTSIVPTADNITHYAEIVRRTSRERMMLEHAAELLALAREHDVDAAEIARRSVALAELATGCSSATAKSQFPLVGVQSLSEIVKQAWLIRGVIPRFDDGAAGYLFGPPKARKSLVLADAALSVTTATPFMGHFEVEHTGAAVGFFAEDPQAETARRIHRLARARRVEVPSNLYLIDVPQLSLDDPRHQERLLATLRQVPDLAFVWLDPMVRLHRINDNHAEELGPIHTFLRTLSRELKGCVIALAHHTNKLGDSRGSTDYGAFGDFNLYTNTPDSITTQVIRLENRGGPPGRPFSFVVEDGYSDDGPTLKLVPSTLALAADRAERDDAAAATVRAFRQANPGMTARAALIELRKAGLELRDAAFFDIWRSVRDDN
jgi:hypothetical protein